MTGAGPNPGSDDEAYFRRLIEYATDAITIVDANGGITYSSPSLRRVLGYTPEERHGHSIFEVVHADDRAEATRVFSAIRANSSTPITTRLRALRKDGAWRVCEVVARNLLHDPVVLGIVINTRDVTEEARLEQERDRAERELRESELRFRSLIESTSDIVAVVDAAANVIYASPSLQRVLGYTPEEIKGISGFDLIDPSEHEFGRAVLVEALESPDRTIAAEFRMRHKKGHVRVLDVRIRNMLAFRPIGGIVINAHDITDRKIVEERLRTSEERYRTIIETAGEGVIIRDSRDYITFVNQRMADLLGYAVDELIGRHILDIVWPDDRYAFEDALRRRREGQTEQYDFRARRKDGSDIWGIVAARPMYSADGTFIGALTMFMDISSRKQLEEQLRQAQKMEAVGRLAGGIAHDFNNLLTAIRGHAELLLGDMPADHPIRPDLEEINRAAERASSLTRQLLAFSRRQLLQLRVLELDTVVGEMEKLIRRLIGEDIELLTSLGTEGARVRADRGQLEQVIMNLAVNARDAMPSGGQMRIVTAVVKLDDEYSRLHPGAVPGEYVCLRIADSGVGMDARTLSHVFEPFFTTKGVGEGTGLGLATVYGIIKQSGGYIAVESEPGAGTAFDIYLPLVRDELENVRERQDNIRSDGAGQTVLLVEDEEAVRSLASRILRKHGYHVLEAGDGLDAVRVSDGYVGFIHVLLTDVVMPRMGGRELAERLTPVRPGMRVLYMSGYTDDALLHHGVLTGAGAWFMEKPFTPAGLIDKLREVFEAD